MQKGYGICEHCKECTLWNGKREHCYDICAEPIKALDQLAELGTIENVKGKIEAIQKAKDLFEEMDPASRMFAGAILTLPEEEINRIKEGLKGKTE